MHGRLKRDLPPSAEERAAERAKVSAFNHVVQAVFERRKNNVLDRDTLKITSKLLQIHPDFYSVWNYRRKILLAISEAPLDPPGDVTLSLDVANGELELSMEAIQRNPKSYNAWYHRRWVVDRADVDLERELKLCALLLTKDERNFHCWNYRRFVSSKVPDSDLKELQFTQEKIDRNFSNYSAFHSRSIILERLKTLDDPTSLQSEADLITQAAFTEPHDQSIWIYHRWLVKTAMTRATADTALIFLQTQLDWCHELEEMEPTCKWVIAALGFLYEQNVKKLTECGSADRCAESTEKATALYQQLQTLDPYHKGYYQHCLQKLTGEGSA